MLDAGAIIVGAPTLNNNIYPSLADVLTYVRQSFGNKASAVTPAQVKAVRDASAGRAAPWNTAELGIK